MKKQNVTPGLIIGIIGIALIVVLLIFSASGVQLDRPRSKYFTEKKVHGYFGFKSLLKKLSYEVKEDRSFYSKDIKQSVILYVDYSDKDTFLQNDALDWIRDGNTLIIDAEMAEFVFDKEISKWADSKEDVNFLKDDIRDITTIETQYLMNEELIDLFDSYDIIAETKSGLFIIQGYLGNGALLIVSDMTLFNNQIFKNDEKEKAYVLDSILSQYKESEILLRERMESYIKTPSFLREFFTGKYSYLTFHICIMFILFVIFTGKRFVKPQNIKAIRHREVTEHIHAVGNLYKRAKAEELISDIDIEFFKTIICKNKIPFNIDINDYEKATQRSNFKKGFILREKLSKEIKSRS